MTTRKACTAPTCPKPVRSSNALYCETHYYRLRRTGTVTLTPKTYPPVIDSGGYIRESGSQHPLAVDGSIRQHRRVLYDTIGAGEHPCHWCSTSVSWDKSYPVDQDGLVVDHLDSDKQNNVISNLVPSCARCNFKRGEAKMTATQRAAHARLTYQGETLCFNEWASRLNISSQSLTWRLNNGWSVERTVTEPRGIFGPNSRRAA